MRPSIVFIAAACLIALAVPASGAATQPAADSAPCWGFACDLINRVCRTAGGGSCVGAMEIDAGKCAGTPCDVVNRVCSTAFKVDCVG